jgi:hypothetical protein
METKRDKVRLRFLENNQLELDFEFSPRVLSREEERSLEASLLAAVKGREPIPVNLISYYQIEQLWRTGNGAAITPNLTIGTMKTCKLIQYFEGETRIQLAIDLHRNANTTNRINHHLLSNELVPIDPEQPIKVSDGVAVFPRMIVNTTPASIILAGEKEPRRHFVSYGPILAFDAVYGVRPRQQFQTIRDANYAKKHVRDIFPKK